MIGISGLGNGLGLTWLAGGHQLLRLVGQRDREAHARSLATECVSLSGANSPIRARTFRFMTTTTVRDGWCSTSVGSRSAPLSASGRILRSWLGNIAGVGGRTSNGCGYCPREADSCGDAGWRGTRRRVARQRVRLMGGWPQVVRRPPRAPLRGWTCSPGRAPSLEPWHPECAGESPPPTMSSRSMQGPVERTSVARRHACAGSVHRMGATRA
jgi:hypothetical protein